MDLVAFLNARLDEDEAAAKLAQTVRSEGWYEVAQQAVACTDTIELSPAYEHIARHDPARVLREVEAKRRIINAGACDPGGDCLWHGPEFHNLLRHARSELAAIYRDHPDYDPAWA